MRRINWILLALVGLALTTACSGTPDKGDNTKNVIKEDVAEVLGMDRDAVDNFDAAAQELAKPKPDLKKAQGLLEKALATAPDFLEAHYNLGIVYERRGKYDEAIKSYEQANKNDRLNTHTVKTTLAIGRAQALKGDAESALRTFEEAHRLEPENLDILNSLAATNFKLGKYDEAVDYVKQVLREENENLTALNTLAQVYTKQDNRSMAVYVFKKAARVALGTIKTDEELQAEPAILVMSGKVKEKEVQRGIAADILNNLGLIYMKMGEIPLAVFNFNAAAKLDPTHIESRLNTGAIYLKYLNYDGAKAQFTEANTAAGGNCTAFLGRGASLYALGKNNDAASDYSTFLESCDGKSPSAHLQLQRIFERSQNFEKAIEHCKKYVEYGNPPADSPVNADYCKALENMAKMSREEPKAPDGGDTATPEENGDAPEEGAPEEATPEGETTPAEGSAE